MFALSVLAVPVIASTLFVSAFQTLRPGGPIASPGPGQQLPPTCSPGSPTCTPPIDCAKSATARFSASPNPVPQGETTTLSWSVTLPFECQRRRDLTVNGRIVATQGSMVVAPLVNTDYALKIGAGVIARRTVRVELPLVVRIADNTLTSVRLLIQALGTHGRVVALAPNVDMDLTGYQGIRIAGNVTLMGEAPQVAAPASRMTNLLVLPQARDARHLGPRLYTRSRPVPLFHIRCDGTNDGENVRLLGFRLQGPTFGVGEGESNLERGIYVYACEHTEIANMELSGWSGQAVYARDTDDEDSDGRMRPPAPGQPYRGTWVHDNYIHHNQHKHGNGYGVESSKGAYVLIERNVFDFNRHAIAASGAKGTSYTARHNLILRGGGYHGRVLNSYTHQVDVHGDEHCIPVLPDDLPFYDEALYNCGNAGDSFWITDNAIQYIADLSIKIRGTPRVGAWISGNVFPHSRRAAAVEPLDDEKVELGANTMGVDTFGEYGVCDFDGDGTDDLFLATGASWWFASGGRMHWVFLNTHRERLSRLGLGDFDGDGRCDVFAVRGGRWQLSSGGTAPWATLPGGYTAPFGELAFGDFNGDGRTDVFHRASTGQWSAISPGVDEWTLARSPMPLRSLRFGDFDGDRITDVLGIDDGAWAVSWSGQTSFAPLPSNLSDPISSLVIADVDGVAGDDLVRYVAEDPRSGRWEVSSAGATDWRTLASLEWTGVPPDFAGILGEIGQPARHVRWLAGKFKDSAGASLLVIDFTRMGRIVSKDRQSFAPHGLYAY